MASQQPPPRRPPEQPKKPSFNLSQLDFDPHRLKLPQAAIVGFVIGIFFHACVVFAVLDDGSSAGGTSAGGGVREDVTLPEASPTATRLADRTDCAAIRGTDYRSVTEQQWFRQNCTGG